MAKITYCKMLNRGKMAYQKYLNKCPQHPNACNSATYICSGAVNKFCDFAGEVEEGYVKVVAN